MLRLKELWRNLGRWDKVFLFLLAVYLLSGLLGTGNAGHLLLLLVVVGVGAVTVVKWLRIGIRRAIWRLRNRLLVAYLFIAVVPILLIVTLVAVSSWVLTSHMAVHLVRSELNRRVSLLEQGARSLAAAPQSSREQTWHQITDMIGEAFPRLDVVLQEEGAVRFPRQPAFEPPPDGWGEVSGVVVKDGLLYGWARAIQSGVTVTVLAPMTHRFLCSLTPGLGNITILEFADSAAAGERQTVPMHPHSTLPGEPGAGDLSAPPPKNRFDYGVTVGVSLPVAIWNAPGRQAGGLLSIHTRLFAVMDRIFLEQTQSGRTLVAVLYGLALIFLVVELISLVIGISITRSITGAFNDLYEGTDRVRQSDFSHRIEVTGNDQLAVINDSFNRMTEYVQRLLVVAKEKERMQTELEIAQAVQRQLYPKTVPALDRLELCAQCNPARMVSGDYYDYQALYDTSAVVAIGDVAGKGISAALLMATLQSALRTQVRACLDNRKGNGGDGERTMSASRLVSQLNEQLYADTSPEKYATFFFSIYDDETGLFTYTNAGHLPPVLIRNGKPTPLDVNGIVVGAFPFAKYNESRFKLERGDLLVAYTDGITEPENEYGEMFGEERAIEIVLRNEERGVGEIIQAVMEAVMEWTGSPELQDDMTILIARRH